MGLLDQPFDATSPSVGGGQVPGRIDVAFFGVRAFHLRDEYGSLNIEKAADVFANGVLAVSSTPSEPLARYLLNGGPDYILATNVAWEEDGGDHQTPSRFGHYEERRKNQNHVASC